jgi:hypothetical protein
LIGNLVSIRESGRIPSITAHDIGCMFPEWNLRARVWGRGESKCCYVGYALRPFALGWRRARKPPGTGDWFTAHPVPSSGFMSPGFRNPPQRCGREATAPPTPRSKRRGVASRADRPKLRRRPIGPRNSGRQFGSIRSDRFRWICNLHRPNRDMMFAAACLQSRVALPNFTPSRAAGFSRHGAAYGGCRYYRPGRSARIFSTMFRTPSLEISVRLLWRSNPSNWSNSDGA